MLTESLTPRPELENNQGLTRSFGDVGSIPVFLKADVDPRSCDVAKVPIVLQKYFARLSA
jgi:hypothetical protein